MSNNLVELYTNNVLIFINFFKCKLFLKIKIHFYMMNLNLNVYWEKKGST